MRMVGSCIVTTSCVITYCVVACSSSRGLPDSCIASTLFQPDACRTVRNSETDLPERFAFRELHPTIRKEPVAMKQLQAQNHFSKRAQSMVFHKIGCELPYGLQLVIVSAV